MQTTSDRVELTGLLTIQKVIKQSRFDKMQTDLNSVKDCEAANKIMLIAVGDCVLTDRKKIIANKTASSWGAKIQSTSDF